MTANAMTTTNATAGALAIADDELLATLKASLYPGADDASVRAVINYCRAARYDPMLRPVHIVPMWIPGKEARDGRPETKGAMRDVIMPGIGMYRVIAQRTGQYAGISEPEFGPTRTLEIGDMRFEYPEWCKVSARRMIAPGVIVDFPAIEYWLECYAPAKRDSKVPNAMWSRRARGMLAKCAEAAALRRGFPEVGDAPTSDEMIGKTADGHDVLGAADSRVDATARFTMPRERADAPTAGETVRVNAGDHMQNGDAPAGDNANAKTVNPTTPKKAAKTQEPDASGGPTLATDGERAFIRRKCEQFNLTEEALCAAIGITSIDTMTTDGFIAAREHFSGLQR